MAGCSAPSNRAEPTEPLPGESEAAWAQPGRTASHTATTSAVSVDDPVRLWHEQTPGPLTAPTVVGDVLFVGEGVPTDEYTLQGSVAAYNRHTGERHWRTPFPVSGGSGGFAGCQPIVHRGSIYIGDAGEHSVYALDARTGERRWHLDLDSSVNEPAVAADGTICFTTGDALHAVDEFGREQWRFAPADEHVVSTAAMAHGSVYVGTFTATDGASGGFYALDRETGDIEWAYQKGNAYGRPSVRDDTIYVADESGIRAFDATDGTVRRHEHIDRLADGVSLAVSDEWVYAPRGQGIIALNRDSDGDADRWRFGTVHPFVAPVVADDRIVASTETDGEDPVTAFGVQHANEPEVDRWRYTLGGDVAYPAAALEDTLYLAAYTTNKGGTLVALGDE